MRKTVSPLLATTLLSVSLSTPIMPRMHVILINLGTAPYKVATGDRIAQAVVAPATTATFELAAELSDSDRGVGGFGSTGQR